MAALSIDDPTDLALAELVAAVAAEEPAAELAHAVRRAGDQNAVVETAQWIYRFPRPWIDLDRELAVLAAIDGRLPVPTPHVEWVGRHTRCFAYRKLTGRAFQPERYRAASRPHQRALAASMADYLVALHHCLSEAELAAIGVPDFYSLADRAELIDLDRTPPEVRPTVLALLDRARELSDQLADRPGARLLLDNDFTSDNVVLDRSHTELRGVWDFSGVSVGPASFDFRALLRDPDPLAEDVVIEYERRTGYEIYREAFLLAFRITDVLRQLRRGSAATIEVVRGW